MSILKIILQFKSIQGNKLGKALKINIIHANKTNNLKKLTTKKGFIRKIDKMNKL